MALLLTLFNSIGKTYIDSFAKDFAKDGLQIVLLLVATSWVGVLFIIGLILSGKFQLPSDPIFYLLWAALVLLATLFFFLFVNGLKESKFLAANSFSNLSFAVTAIFGAMFLGELLTPHQYVAIAIALCGAALFLEFRETQSRVRSNRGLLLIFLSLLLVPLQSIIYKAATFHTDSYHQFISGRLTVDFIFYSLLFLCIAFFWYRKNPWTVGTIFLASPPRFVFATASAFAYLLDSWLIFRLPISTFTILGTVAIPTSYFIGRLKYGEAVQWPQLCGALLIALGVAGFVLVH